MPFVNEILKHRSLSIVGLEKNTGKTVCLNYVLKRLHELRCRTAVTSIGIDGERIDQVYGSAKPEIVLYEGMRFITSEKHYRQRELVSKVLEIDEQSTSLGRLITGEVVCEGKILLSGASTTEKLRRQIERFGQSRDLTIVDGALSRMSLASPTVTDAMILATGAAVSPNMAQLVSKTNYVFGLINLEETEDELKRRLSPIRSGIWAVDGDDTPHDLGIASAFLISRSEGDMFRFGKRIFVSGALNDVFLKHLMAQNRTGLEVIVRDFTKIFATPEVFRAFCKKTGCVKVLQRSNLIAICVNPVSPQGYNMNSNDMRDALSEKLQIPVFDVKNI